MKSIILTFCLITSASTFAENPSHETTEAKRFDRNGSIQNLTSSPARIHFLVRYYGLADNQVPEQLAKKSDWELSEISSRWAALVRDRVESNFDEPNIERDDLRIAYKMNLGLSERPSVKFSAGEASPSQRNLTTYQARGIKRGEEILSPSKSLEVLSQELKQLFDSAKTKKDRATQMYAARSLKALYEAAEDIHFRPDNTPRRRYEKERQFWSAQIKAVVTSP